MRRGLLGRKGLAGRVGLAGRDGPSTPGVCGPVEGEPRIEPNRNGLAILAWAYAERGLRMLLALPEGARTAEDCCRCRLAADGGAHIGHPAGSCREHLPGGG